MRGHCYLPQRRNIKNQWWHNELHLESCQAPAEGPFSSRETKAVYTNPQQFFASPRQLGPAESLTRGGVHWLSLWKGLPFQPLMRQSAFVYFSPLSSGISLWLSYRRRLPTPSPPPTPPLSLAIYQPSLPRPSLAQRHSEFSTPLQLLTTAFFFFSSSPSFSFLSSKRQFRQGLEGGGGPECGSCEEVQKASSCLFPYGLPARMLVCTVARWEETTQAKMHVDSRLPKTNFDRALIDVRSRRADLHLIVLS